MSARAVRIVIGWLMMFLCGRAIVLNDVVSATICAFIAVFCLVYKPDPPA